MLCHPSSDSDRIIFLNPTIELQIGVLAWCSEFEDLVSEIKSLGFSGEMAAQTRDCALEACQEVLKLELDIRAQLIIMYLVWAFIFIG